MSSFSKVPPPTAVSMDTDNSNSSTHTATEGSHSRDSSVKCSTSPINPSSMFNSNDTSRPGEKTICQGKYIVKQTLGSGATGKVKLGIDTRTGEEVALKLMAVRQSSTRQRSQIEREVRSMRCVDHPGILGLKDVDPEVLYRKSDGSTKAFVLLVLELAGNGELFDFMMYTGAFSERIAKTYTMQLLSALGSCHKEGVYHRDLKPENLLLDGEYQLKVADFGFAANVKNVTSDGSSNTLLHTECGTRSYMAPEILAHQPYCGEKADVWSLGVVIFIMITGNPPFQIANGGDWWFNALKAGNVNRFWKAHMRSCPNISDGARAFLERMLKPVSGDRCSLEDLMSDPWLVSEGGQLSANELTSLMDKKKKKVDEGKKVEREKARKAAEEERMGGQFDPFAQGEGVRRGEDSNEKDVDSSVTTLPVLTRSNADNLLYVGHAFASTSTSSTNTRVEAVVAGLTNLLKIKGFVVADQKQTKNTKIKATHSEKDVQLVIKLFKEEGLGVALAIDRRGGDIFGFTQTVKELGEGVKMNGGIGGFGDSGVGENLIVDDGDMDMI